MTFNVRSRSIQLGQLESAGSHPHQRFGIDDADREIQVYWRNEGGQVVRSKSVPSWTASPPTAVLNSLRPGYQFNVLQWSKGKFLRLYYQDKGGNALVEHSSDNYGSNWSAVVNSP